MPPPSEHHARAAQAFHAGRYDQAAESATLALRRTPNNPNQLYIRGASLTHLSNAQDGLVSLLEADRRAPNTPHILSAMANAYRLLDRTDEALAACERALAAKPGFEPAVSLKSTVLRSMGRAEEAMRFIEPQFRDNPQNPTLACEFADCCLALKQYEQGVAALEPIAQEARAIDIRRRAPGAATVFYRLAGLYDKLKRYDDAFHAAAEANRGRAGRFTPAGFVKKFWTRDLLDRLPAATKRGVTPVLVVGMPRSGTTLTERIIASHPDGGGVGESQALPNVSADIAKLGRLPSEGWMNTHAQQYLAMLARAAPTGTHVVDKLPGNYANLGLASKLVPDARVIHCIRDPRDVCLSCYFQDFSMSLGFTTDLVNCAKQYRAQEQVMAHWHALLDIPIFELRYEQLVAEPEPTIRALLEFLGMPWDDACLAFHENAGYVRTASWDQVNKPLYASSSGKWKNYEKHLGPMLEELGLADTEQSA
ncbi:MAG: sulfotransferase [Phycisphaerales bacterium]